MLAREVGDSLLIMRPFAVPLSHASRALLFMLVGKPGFRFAPPQALCYRRAPRAKAMVILNLIRAPTASWTTTFARWRSKSRR